MKLKNAADRTTYLTHFLDHPDDITRLQVLKSKALRVSSVTRLFKYCRPETARLIMKHGLLLQAPDSYNDPFDCLANVNVWSADYRFEPDAATVDAVRSELNSLPPKYQLSTYNLHHDMRMSYSVATTCFSEQFDEHLLWSHYGDNHKGICLAFDVADLIEELHPCAYQTALPMATKWRTDNMALALIKGTAWSYEKEWRLVRKTTRPTMRVLGSLMHQIYNHIHSDRKCTVSDREEWSQINSSVQTRLEEKYNRERVVDVRPTQIILGLNTHHQFANVKSGTCCDDIREIAGLEGIPVMRMQVKPGSFDLTSVDVVDRLGWTQPLS